MMNSQEIMKIKKWKFNSPLNLHREKGRKNVGDVVDIEINHFNLAYYKGMYEDGHIEPFKDKTNIKRENKPEIVEGE